MDWLELVESIVSFFVAVVVYRLMLWVTHREVMDEHKYKFQCPMCDFRVASNDRQVVMMDRVAHRHSMIKPNSR